MVIVGWITWIILNLRGLLPHVVHPTGKMDHLFLINEDFHSFPLPTVENNTLPKTNIAPKN